MNNNDIKFKDFYNNIYDVLKIYNDDGSLSVGEKVKTKELEFLSNVQLFGIRFSIFNEEKKNTKRTLINYLHEFYIVSNFLKCSSNGDSTENLFNEIHNMVKDLNAPNVISTKTTNNRKKKQSEPNSILDGINMADLSNTTGIDFSPFDNLMKNNDIMSIANELSSEMSSLDIDPMSMMTSLMSGNLKDNKLGSLLSSISGKITQKINSGAIDKNALEQQAGLFMQNISTNPNLMSLANNLNLNKK